MLDGPNEAEPTVCTGCDRTEVESSDQAGGLGRAGAGLDSPTAVLRPSWDGSKGPPKTPRRVETMWLPRMRSPRGSTRRRVALWSALAMGGILPSVGCQVEYAGMTLPSGKYMHDDVQYFPSGPDFPWANTQAATQRARMRAMGIEPPPPPGTVPVAAGAIDATQNPRGGIPTNVNTQQMLPANVPPPPPPGGVPAPAGNVPPPGGVPAPDGNVPPPGN
jgi:hypothetical protein